MNLSQIQSEVGRLLNDPSNSRWTTDVLTTRANQAQTEIQGLTNAIKSVLTITPIVLTSAYNMGSPVMGIIRVNKTINGNITPLEGINREELDFRYPNWQQLSPGEPILWFWSESGNDLNLVPASDSNFVLNGSITMFYSKMPTALVDPTDIPFNANAQMIPYHMAIVHWVTAYCWMDDGTPEALSKSKFHKSGSMENPGQYEKQLGRIMAEFDVADQIQSNILWQPQGGRIGTWFIPNKSAPLEF